MRSIIATLVPITRANSKIEIPAASASVAKVWSGDGAPRSTRELAIPLAEAWEATN